MVEFLSPDVAPGVLGILVLAVFLIIMSLEVYYFQRPNHYKTFVMIFTLFMFVVALIVILNTDVYIISSVILLLGSIMGIAIGLLMTRAASDWDLK